LGLEKVFFDRVETMATPATIIPSDIPAAVAYGKIGSLVILAAAAGCKSIVMAGEYPACWAPGLQLNFRSHPLLGLVAAFTTYGFKPVYRATSPDDLRVAYYHSQGILKYAGKEIQNPFLTMNRTIRVKGAYGPIPIDERVAAEFGSSRNNFDHVGGIWLLVGDIPIEVRVFPSVNLQVHAIASALATQDIGWMDRSGIPHPTAELGMTANMTLPGASRSIIVDGKYGEEALPDHIRRNCKAQFHSWMSNSEEDRRPSWPDRMNLTSFHRQNFQPRFGVTIIILKKALKICSMWLRNPRDFRIATTFKAHYRVTVLLQLLELDYWLSKSRKEEALKSATMSLFEQGGGLLKIAKRFEDLPSEQSFDATQAAWVERSIGNGNAIIQKIRNVFTRGLEEDWDLVPADKYAQVSFEAVLGEYHIVERGLQQFRPQRAKPQEPSSMSEIQARKRVDQAIEESEERQRRKLHDPLDQEIEEDSAKFYLIFRAVLYGCLLDTGADNSCILDVDISQQTSAVL
jgi:hypothetical protein